MLVIRPLNIFICSPAFAEGLPLGLCWLWNCPCSSCYLSFSLQQLKEFILRVSIVCCQDSSRLVRQEGDISPRFLSSCTFLMFCGPGLINPYFFVEIYSSSFHQSLSKSSMCASWSSKTFLHALVVTLPMHGYTLISAFFPGWTNLIYVCCPLFC